jgi:hypothetical protein
MELDITQVAFGDLNSTRRLSQGISGLQASGFSARREGKGRRWPGGLLRAWASTRAWASRRCRLPCGLLAAFALATFALEAFAFRCFGSSELFTAPSCYRGGCHERIECSGRHSRDVALSRSCEKLKLSDTITRRGGAQKKLLDLWAYQSHGSQEPHALRLSAAGEATAVFAGFCPVGKTHHAPWASSPQVPVDKFSN